MNAKIEEYKGLVGKPVYLETRTKGWSGGRAVGILEYTDLDGILHLRNPACVLSEQAWPVGLVKASSVTRLATLSEIQKFPHELLFREGIMDSMVEVYLKNVLLASYGYQANEDNLKRELEIYLYFWPDGSLRILQLALRGTPPKGQAYFFYEDGSLAVLQKSRIKYNLYVKEDIPSALHDFYKLTAKLAMNLLTAVSFNAL